MLIIMFYSLRKFWHVRILANSTYLPHTNSIILLPAISACSSNCIKCDSSTSCTKCKRGYAVVNEQCEGKNHGSVLAQSD